MAQRRIPKEWERVAVPTGAVNGVDVLDVDTKNGATDWWWQHFAAMPKTRTQVTESGGYHVFFRHAEALKCSQSRVAPAVDVRADGGYVIDWSREGLPVANGDVFAPWPEDCWPLRWAWLSQSLAAMLARETTLNPMQAYLYFLPSGPSWARPKAKPKRSSNQDIRPQAMGSCEPSLARERPGSLSCNGLSSANRLAIEMGRCFGRPAGWPRWW
jgi:hypothetical protein